MSDDHVQIGLIGAVYPNTVEAQVKLNELVSMHKDGTIELVDAAVMVRNQFDELSIPERAELTPGKGAKRGAVIGVLFAFAARRCCIGTAAGAITGKVTDQGFENEMLQDIAGELELGQSAILAVVEHTWYAKMMDAIDGYERIVERTLTADEAGSISLST